MGELEILNRDYGGKEMDRQMILEEIDVDSVLERIFSRFYKVARQLRDRYNNRSTLEIEDEYDVQEWTSF